MAGSNSPPDPSFIMALQNSVKGLNGIGQTGLYLSGNTTSATYATSVILSTQAGWVATAQVIVAGSTPGYIHNCQTFAALAQANQLMPLQNTLGQQKAGVNFNNGLILVPGSGQVVNVTYSVTPQQAQV